MNGHAIFLIGPPKTASTSIYSLLTQTGDCSFFEQKEPNIFNVTSPDRTKEFADFVDASSVPVIDATTHYFASDVVPARILSIQWELVSVVASVRNPFDQLLSSYNHNVRSGRDSRQPEQVFPSSWIGRPLDELIELEAEAAQHAAGQGQITLAHEEWKAHCLPFRYLYTSHFGEHLSRWEAAFGERFKVLSFDAISKSQLETNNSLRSWLGLPPSTERADRTVKTNEGFIYSSRQLRKVHKALQPLAKQLPPGIYDRSKRLWRSQFMERPHRDLSPEMTAWLKRVLEPDAARVPT